VGFTLVELLVVIGIIAILAGVALGPITSGIRKANQSKGLQTAHVLALAEFQYANDNNQAYPDSLNTGANNGGATAVVSVANCLVNGGYISDPSIFYINSAPSETKYTGAMTLPVTITQTSISWDFAGASNGSGVNSNYPDQLPLLWSSNTKVTNSLLQNSSTTAQSVVVAISNPFGTQGMAVCYKSNSAQFLVSSGSTGSLSVPLFPAGYPGSTAIALPGGG
jgi:prepilin-type N-terminal cleavage/methylation domain-containing protein